jgi:peroxiredoxin
MMEEVKDLKRAATSPKTGPLSITLPVLDENKRMSLFDLRGKVVFLTFFTSWRPYSDREATDLKDIASRYTEKGVVFLGVNIEEETNDPSFPARGFRDKHDLNHPILVDQYGRLKKQFNVNNVPTYLILNKEGKVHYRGAKLDVQRMMRMLDELTAN